MEDGLDKLITYYPEILFKYKEESDTMIMVTVLKDKSGDKGKDLILKDEYDNYTEDMIGCLTRFLDFCRENLKK